MENGARTQDLPVSGVHCCVGGRHEKKKRDDEPEPDRPPGDFMEEQFADDTARFLAEVKRLADRRKRRDKSDSWTPPSR